MKYFFACFSVLLQFNLGAQFIENFIDGDFSQNPTWIGDDSVFTITSVTSNDLLLNSNKQIPNSSFYLSTPSSMLAEAQWEFYVNLQFNTSSANYVDIYLAVDQSNLLNDNKNGYFVRIGGTQDEVSLYKNIAGTITKIIDGQDGVTNNSNNKLRIKVTRSGEAVWTLLFDDTGFGTDYTYSGSIQDTAINQSSYFGFLILQSTPSFFGKHFIDDIYVGSIIFDTIPPILQSVNIVNTTQLEILFDEVLDEQSAEILTNYSISPTLPILTVALDTINRAMVHLTLSEPLINGLSYTLQTTAIADTNSNASTGQIQIFNYLVSEQVIPGDLIINELMCDPNPMIGLPEVEYVELYNKSSKYFNLNGWKLGDASSAGTIQEGWIYPGEYKILCASAYVDTFAVTATAVTNFPSLNNAGDDIVLKDTHGIVIDQISYSDEWYQDEMKKQGGYSIERIQLNDPCSDRDNWKASNSEQGGTPGFVNSVNDTNPDTIPPKIISTQVTASDELQIVFSEAMDSLNLFNANFIINPAINIQSLLFSSDDPMMATVHFQEELQTSRFYELTVENATDCWFNTASMQSLFVLPDSANYGDLVINEILFNPFTGGSDWIELLNTSNKIIDLDNWQLAHFDDSISGFKPFGKHRYLTPNEYVVLGEDSTFVKQHYPFATSGTFEQLDLPTYNNDSGTVILMYDSMVMDRVSYSEDWHFKLLNNTDGVSLERIDPSGPSDLQFNWHSAAESVGFATPGGQNSQYRSVENNGDFSYTSLTISPDNDGFEDVLQVTYKFNESGLIGSFTIFDERGRKIRKVFCNELLATSGAFMWDGLNDQQLKAPIGPYVGLLECFSISGQLIYTKTKAFVVAGKM